MTAATPGRDELREQIAAALGRHRVHAFTGREVRCACAVGGSSEWMTREQHTEHLAAVAASVVDTWVAAHTEQGAEDEQAAAAWVEERASLIAWAQQEEALADEADATVARVRAALDDVDPVVARVAARSLAKIRAALDPPEGRNQ